MPNPFTRVEAAVLRTFGRPPLHGVAEHGAFWSLLVVLFSALPLAFPGQHGGTATTLLIFAIPVWWIFSSILIYRWLVTHALWKVRNRLIVTYLLMGLAPVVLFATLAAIAAYMFSGQFATFAATAELDKVLGRLSAENQAFAVHVAHAMARAPSATSADLADYDAATFSMPGRVLVDAWSDGRRIELTEDGKRLPQHGVDDPIAFPSWCRDGYRGVVLDDGRLFLRAVNTRAVAGHQITFVSTTPLDASTINQLAQGLGLMHIIPDVSKSLEDDDAKASHLAQQRPTPRQLAEQTAMSVRGGVLPPSAFLLDRRIEFSAPLDTTDWPKGKRLTSLLSVTSRPSLLYEHLFGSANLFGTTLHVGTFIRYILITLTVVFGVLELFAFIMAVRLNRTITNAIGDLYQATVAIDGGDFGHRIRVQRPDQLGALSTSFNAMSESLERLLEQQREKERMQNELEIAQEVQNNLFPHSQLELPGLELHGICRPARTVSGDYYDFLLMGESELCLALGDISGKGISAALLMASLHSAVHAYGFGDRIDAVSSPARHNDSSDSAFGSPGKVLGMLNRHLYRSTQPEKYATLFLAHYSTETRRLVYSNGGQLPPFVLCANGTVRRLEQGGTVVGLLDNRSYEEGSVTLDTGDILIAYSDGVTEPENEFGEFGEERLIETVARHRTQPLAVISQHVLQALRAWIGDQEQPDDITLVLARQVAMGITAAPGAAAPLPAQQN